jgi:hypothetical protein
MKDSHSNFGARPLKKKQDRPAPRYMTRVMSDWYLSYRARLLQPEAYSRAEAERERMALLNKAPAPTPAALVAPTRCRVLRAFCIAGERVEPGATVTLERHAAHSLAAAGRLELLA